MISGDNRIGFQPKKMTVFIILLTVWVIIAGMIAGMLKQNTDWCGILYQGMSRQCMEIWNPYLLYADSDRWQNDVTENFRQLAWDTMPLYRCLQNGQRDTAYVQSELVYDADMILKGMEEEQSSHQKMPEQDTAQETTQEIGQENIMNDTPAVEVKPQGEFVPAASKSVTYMREQLSNPDFIKKQFYTEDATTQIMPEQLDIDKLLGFDAVMKQDASKPQILIYHTHSQEGFVDSDMNDASTTIMGVGEYLSAILRKQYGYNVLHHMGQYDVESRDYAYSNAAVGLEQVLAENPSIEVIIDLHRDEMREGVRLVTTLQGKNVAKFMFFNGLSYTRERGEITTLPNPYIQENLSFAFQMKLTAEEYYPGLTRKSYLKGYRYNLQYRPKSLLIELGAQTNTVAEAMDACPAIAHILDLVLRGKGDE